MSGIEQTDSAYTLSIDEGTYWVEGYDENGRQMLSVFDKSSPTA